MSSSFYRLSIACAGLVLVSVQAKQDVNLLAIHPQHSYADVENIGELEGALREALGTSAGIRFRVVGGNGIVFANATSMAVEKRRTRFGFCAVCSAG